jgi:hypothetical protein
VCCQRKIRNARQGFLHRTTTGLVRSADVIAILNVAATSSKIRHDRDLNAAKNVLAVGRAAVRGDSDDACGADGRRHGVSLPQSAVEQEPLCSDAGESQLISS